MHPKEAYKQKTGTGRLAALSLAGAEIIVRLPGKAQPMPGDRLTVVAPRDTLHLFGKADGRRIATFD